MRFMKVWALVMALIAVSAIGFVLGEDSKGEIPENGLEIVRELNSELASLEEEYAMLRSTRDWLESTTAFIELGAGEPTFQPPIAKLTPYCHNIMKTWLHRCVFTIDAMPNPLEITPECRRIYNINAKECIDSGVMTDDQTARWGQLQSQGGQDGGAPPADGADAPPAE